MTEPYGAAQRIRDLEIRMEIVERHSMQVSALLQNFIAEIDGSQGAEAYSSEHNAPGAHGHSAQEG
jgi:hypothetical protein